MILPFLAILTASPTTLPAQLTAAAPGDQIQLAPGDYGHVTLPRRANTPPVTLAAGAARMTSFNAYGSAGYRLVGGTIVGGNASGYGVSIRASQRMQVIGVRVEGVKRGFVVLNSTDVDLFGNAAVETTVDGFVTAESQRVNIVGNTCVSNSTGKEHPDCYQSWSRPGKITTDLIFVGNTARGNVQGISLFNHEARATKLADGTTAMLNDGGYDRIVIVNNGVDNLYPQGINASDVRGLVLTGNRAASLAGARWRTSINVARSTGTFCGNVSPDTPKGVASQACPK